MQKKILAAVVASMVSGQAMAVTVIDNGTTKAEIGGYLDLRYVDQDKGLHDSDSSRINFAFEHKMTEATTAFAKTEWSIDTDSDNSNEDFIGHRLSYIGVMNSELGSVSYGKQWSSYGMVAGYTDVFAATGGDASGYYNGEAEFLGTSRADDALQYNHSVMGLNISAQTQLGKARNSDNINEKRDSSYGIAASYDMPMGLSLGAAYNQADVERTGGNDYKAKSAVIGAKFDADKLYAAFTYSDLSNVVETNSDSNGIELYVSYQMNEMFKVEGGYNQLKSENATTGADLAEETKYLPVAVVYTQGPVQLSGTYQFEKSTDDAGKDLDDKMVLQARYYF